MLREWVAKAVVENSFIAGIILFGSTARGEQSDRSDIDLLVLWDDIEMARNEAYVYVYKAVAKHFPPQVSLTILDMRYADFMNIQEATPLILNIIWDGVVLYDRYGKLEELLTSVRKALQNMNITPCKRGKYYYWRLPKPGSQVEINVAHDYKPS
ncbi:MAG: nucleotidyltransferase domain-containing protein [Aigarchaeota archaeon]|nr:nucleotidyltransferase domain-containing protein [Candidatus Pelearchaeum maunauluense]